MQSSAQRRWLALAAFCGATLIADGSAAAPVTDFGTYVAQAYAEIAMVAATRAREPALAKYFADRSRLVRGDELIEPAFVDQWPLEAAGAREARAARQQLSERLDAGARLSAPLQAA